MKWAAVEASPDEWKPALPDATCRWRGSHDPAACGAEAAVRTVRGVKRLIWWNYCQRHGFEEYGHWLENGKVFRYEEQPAPPAAGSGA
jgi:hypothetical protein